MGVAGEHGRDPPPGGLARHVRHVGEDDHRRARRDLGAAGERHGEPGPSRPRAEPSRLRGARGQDERLVEEHACRRRPPRGGCGRPRCLLPRPRAPPSPASTRVGERSSASACQFARLRPVRRPDLGPHEQPAGLDLRAHLQAVPAPGLRAHPGLVPPGQRRAVLEEREGAPPAPAGAVAAELDHPVLAQPRSGCGGRCRRRSSSSSIQASQVTS